MISEDQQGISVSARAYRRECYWDAGFSIFLGAALMIEAVSRWKKRNALEKSWANFRFYPENRDHIEKHPHLYQDDLIDHIKQTQSKDAEPPEHAG